MSFGSRFKKARESKKFSQQDLADLISVTDGTISNYEKGVAFPRWDTLKKLCDILGVDPNYLFWDDLNENLKSQIIEKMTFNNNDEGIRLYKQLDEIDQAEIRGTMKQMLKTDKYHINVVDTDNNGFLPNHSFFSDETPAQVAAFGGDGVTFLDDEE